MRWCRKRSWLSLLAALWLALAAAVPAQADGIEVRKATLVSAENSYYLEAEFSIALTHTLEEALSKGVPLYFLLEFELIRPRWYWFNDELANGQYQFRLSFNSITRQYRVGVGTLYENFTTLGEALAFLSKVRVGDVVPHDALSKGTRYTAGVRMRLDGTQLPRSFQVSAVGSREWSVGSDWFRWGVTP
ncbi:MAG TPA: DUF4390 domain-containing protein [Burkholderiales bacterium]|nr:DUF4390 domain-containing protein [Burkholderiales bacterium]